MDTSVQNITGFDTLSVTHTGTVTPCTCYMLCNTFFGVQGLSTDVLEHVEPCMHARSVQDLGLTEAELLDCRLESSLGFVIRITQVLRKHYALHCIVIAAYLHSKLSKLSFAVILAFIPPAGQISCV